MGKEIERKFLVNGKIPSSVKGFTLQQGYLQLQKERSVRIRTIESANKINGYLTIKGIGDETGASRYEFEIEIPVPDAKYLLTLCDQPLIKKTRYNYPFGGFLWEIDEFHDVNAGLILAEIELESINQEFDIPDFIGKEVTGEVEYYNLMLLKNPFTAWK
ncbi:MAG: CYTH domain-containing protein [Candidatus Marinimicrobia bacterium]|nr:CYTH domain-containing protein [Candidatus Neomarinimicrobiota bacterium]